MPCLSLRPLLSLIFFQNKVIMFRAYPSYTLSNVQSSQKKIFFLSSELIILMFPSLELLSFPRPITPSLPIPNSGRPISLYLPRMQKWRIKSSLIQIPSLFSIRHVGFNTKEKRKISFSALAVSKSGHMKLLNASLRLRFANSALVPLDLLLNIILIVRFALMMAILALIAFTPPHVEIA